MSEINNNESTQISIRAIGSEDGMPDVGTGDDTRNVIIFNMGQGVNARGLYIQNADDSFTRLVPEDEVKGGADSLAERLATISNFASPNAGGVITGQYYDNSFQGTNSSTLAGVANRIDLAPYYTSVTLNIDQIGLAVSTAVASAQGKVVIYEAGADGWPDTLLFESGALDFSSTGYKSEALTFTFTSGKIYWIGARHSSTATIRTINVSSSVNLGLISSTAANYATLLRRTVTFANSAPNPWNFVNGDRVAASTPPSVRFRAA